MHKEKEAQKPIVFFILYTTSIIFQNVECLILINSLGL